MNDKFYCYSTRLHCFLKALKFRYIDEGVNKNSNKNYWIYDKSDELDGAIALYNEIKHRYN